MAAGTTLRCDHLGAPPPWFLFVVCGLAHVIFGEGSTDPEGSRTHVRFLFPSSIEAMVLEPRSSSVGCLDSLEEAGSNSLLLFKLLSQTWSGRTTSLTAPGWASRQKHESA